MKIFTSGCFLAFLIFLYDPCRSKPTMSQPHQVSVQIEDESPTEPVPRTTATLQRLDPVTRPGVGNRTFFGDRLNNVIREIRPLVEHARMGNNPRLSLPTWLPTTSRLLPHEIGTTDLTTPRPSTSIAHINLGPNSQTYIITDNVNGNVNHAPQAGGSGNTTEENNSENEEAVDVNICINPVNNNNISIENIENDNQSEDGHQQLVDIRATLHLLIKYAPFYLILFLKFMYDCREGLFAFFLLFSTFIYSNNLVRRENGKQISRSVLALCLGLFYTLTSVYIVHVLFGHGKLLSNLIMFPFYDTPMNVWDLIWLVVLTDLIVKIFTVDFKMLVTMLPGCLLPFQKRGKVYLFVETVSQLYRALLTIQPWLYYLLNSYEGHERFGGMFLASLYAVAKIIEVILRLRIFKNATWTLLQSVNLGTKPTHEQLMSAGDTCPICHDDYTAPVRLGCGHIFCELCIAAWLDRDHTCPLCRAKVSDEPTWRDGSTTFEFQLY